MDHHHLLAFKAEERELKLYDEISNSLQIDHRLQEVCNRLRVHHGDSSHYSWHFALMRVI